MFVHAGDQGQFAVDVVEEQSLVEFVSKLVVAGSRLASLLGLDLINLNYKAPSDQ